MELDMEKVDITIIGAGIIGLAVAAEISKPDLSVLVLDKNQKHGTGISSRNSEVIHSGIYYPPDSMKASFCVEGNKLIYEIASKNGIPHKRTGKLIVAVKKEESEDLERLRENGLESGVSGLELIGKKQIAGMEPNVEVQTALYSPDTGIISVHDLMDYFLTRAQRRKAQLVCRTKVVRIEKDFSHYRIFTQNEQGKSFEFSSSVVINAAGLESDIIAKMTGARYQLHYCKGDYCSVTSLKPKTIQRLIYPVPVKKHTGLGIHLTMDLNGRVKLGPDATYIERKEDYQVAEEKTDLFFQSASKFLPFLKKENIHPDMAGIRPKLQGPDDGFRDFVIKEDSSGFINLVGIESPGLTASPAIARFVKRML